MHQTPRMPSPRLTVAFHPHGVGWPAILLLPAVGGASGMRQCDLVPACGHALPTSAADHTHSIRRHAHTAPRIREPGAESEPYRAPQALPIITTAHSPRCRLVCCLPTEVVQCLCAVAAVAAQGEGVGRHKEGRGVEAEAQTLGPAGSGLRAGEGERAAEGRGARLRSARRCLKQLLTMLELRPTHAGRLREPAHTMPAGHAVAFRAWQRSALSASPLPLVFVGRGAVANAKKFHRKRSTSLFTVPSGVCGSAWHSIVTTGTVRGGQVQPRGGAGTGRKQTECRTPRPSQGAKGAAGGSNSHRPRACHMPSLTGREGAQDADVV